MSVRATGLVNFKGERYVVQPEIEQLESGSMAVKPYNFTAEDMTASNGNLTIDIPGIVLNVFNSDMESVAYGGIDFGTDNEGKCRTTFVIEDYAETDIVLEGNDVTHFMALSFVRKDGTPFEMLPAEDI